MNEKKKLYVVLSLLAIIIVSVVALTIYTSKKNKAEYEKFEAAFNGSENSLLYIGSSTCGWCSLLNPSIQEMASRYNFDYLHIDVSKYSQSNYAKVLSKLGVTSVGTPYLAIISNGKVVDKTPNGYADYDELFKFLQKYDIIDKDAKLLLNYIGLEEYDKALKGSEKSVVVIGKSTCSHCVNAKLVLNQVAEETGLKINYLNTTNLTTDEDKKLQASLDYFNKSWGTPVTFILQDGKLVEVLEGETTKEKYIEFFTEQGVL